METMTPFTQRSGQRADRLKAKKLRAYRQPRKVTRDEQVDIFDANEERIPQIAEVTKAEENAREIYGRIADYDAELAFSMDMVIGALARAYEKQGFNAGMAVARGAL